MRAAIAEGAAHTQVVLTNGSTGLSAAQIDALPALRLVAALGAGHENIAVAHAQQRGIAVVNGAGTNDDCVADHTLGLLLAVARGLPQQQQALRDGLWREALPLYPQLAHSRLGIVGLGTIGLKIARRAAAFDMQVGYHNRRPRSDSALPWFDSVTALAAWCDHLVIATPGGPGTRHLVDAAVLRALGPRGHLVNIARGSVVDTAALVAALEQGALQGAGLDVFEGEPTPPPALLALPNVVLTPHVAGWSPQAIAASVDLFVRNLQHHAAGEPLLTPVHAA